MELLSDRPKIRTESHLSIPAYSFAHFKNGKPTSLSTRMFLELAGYPTNEEGLRKAMLDEYASAVGEINSENVFLKGEDGFRKWKDGSAQALGFNANLPVSLITSAIHKNKAGKFSVDALASDGGGIPRNILLTKGVDLIRFGALTYTDLVIKLAVAPSKMYGLKNKGHLSVGADADITIFQPETGNAVYALAAGQIILDQSKLTGSGSQLISTDRIVDRPKDLPIVSVSHFFA